MSRLETPYLGAPRMAIGRNVDAPNRSAAQPKGGRKSETGPANPASQIPVRPSGAAVHVTAGQSAASVLRRAS
jgi:hypothetical protein